MFSLRTIRTSLLGLLLIPSVSLAATPNSMDIWQKILAMQGKPAHMNIESYVQVPNELELHIKGTMDTEGTNINNYKMQTELFISGNATDMKDINLHVWAKVVNQGMYVRAKSTNAEISAGLATMNIDEKKWLYINLEEFVDGFNTGFTQGMGTTPDEIAEAMDMSQEELMALSLKVVNAIFTVDTKKIKNGTEYTMTLQKNFLENVTTLMSDVVSNIEELDVTAEEILADIDMTELRIAQELLNNSLVFKIKVTTNAKNDITQQKLYASFANENIAPGARFGLLVTNTPHAALELYAPSKSSSRQVSIEELMGGYANDDSTTEEYDAEYNNTDDSYEDVPVTNEESQASTSRTYYQKPSVREIKDAIRSR